MIIKNIGSKIINIGSAVLMPDSEIRVSTALSSIPSIQTFVRMGLIKIEGDNEGRSTKAVVKKNAEDESATTKNADETVKRKTQETAVKTKESSEAFGGAVQS